MPIDWKSIPDPEAPGFPAELTAWRDAQAPPVSKALLAEALGVKWLAVDRWERGTRGARRLDKNTLALFNDLRARGARAILDRAIEAVKKFLD